MTQPEKQKLFQDATAKLRRASQFAEAMAREAVATATASTLSQLAAEASSAVKVLSVACNNSPPPFCKD